MVPASGSSAVGGVPPLHGVRVVELGGVGPVPHAGLMLARAGASVVRLERPGSGEDRFTDSLRWGRHRVVADLRDAGDRDAVLELVQQADVVLEGFRPGVAERLGVGPGDCASINPRLVYGRVTGWGSSGPLSQQAGHDINYLALSGLLDNIGPADGAPTPPLGMVGDFGAGSMFLLYGVLAALLERERTGVGQTVEAAIIDGLTLLAEEYWEWNAHGSWGSGRGANVVDGSAPFYSVYECADGGYVAVGAFEPQFFARLLDGLGILASALPDQWDAERWPELRGAIAATFRTRDRDTWVERFALLDACVSPVLSFHEAAAHPHLVARGTLEEQSGSPRPGSGIRLSRSAMRTPSRRPVDPVPVRDFLAGQSDKWPTHDE